MRHKAGKSYLVIHHKEYYGMSREGLFVRVDLRLWYLTTIFPTPTLPNFPDRLPHLKTNVDKYKWFGVVQIKITLLDSIARHYYYFDRAWWRHQMETIFPRNWPFVRGIHRGPVTRSFDVYFDLRPNTRLSKQSWGWWFETPSRPLWRHRNGNEILREKAIIYALCYVITVWCRYNAVNFIQNSHKRPRHYSDGCNILLYWTAL